MSRRYDVEGQEVLGNRQRVARAFRVARALYVASLAFGAVTLVALLWLVFAGYARFAALTLFIGFIAAFSCRIGAGLISLEAARGQRLVNEHHPNERNAGNQPASGAAP